MRNYNGFLAFLSVLMLPILCPAQQPLFQEIKADGDHHTLTVSSTSAPSKKVTFWYVSNGNLSTILNVLFEGPEAATVSMRMRPFKSEGAQSLLGETKGWIGLNLTNAAGRDRANYTFPAAPARSATSRPPAEAAKVDCSGLSEEAIQKLLDFYKNAFGTSITRAELCENIDPGSGTGGTGGSGGSDNGATSPVFRSLLSKDTCSKSSKYLVQIEFDLNAVAQASLDKGVSLLASVDEYEYNGSKAASIKPISDGKFAPRPLILMSSVGGYYTNEQISLVRWGRGKIKSRKILKFAKSLYYKNLFLSSALVDGVLTGGKGTFEITNGVDIYSVCMKLQRTRQRVNGYP